MPHRRPRPQTFVIRLAEFPLAGRVFRRPMLPVRLSWRGRSTELPMLLDTGSDSTFIPADLASYLGLELSVPVRHIRAAGGRFEAREAKGVYVQIDHRDTLGHKGNPKEIAPVLVPSRADILEEPVLGREPFMEAYELTLRQRAGEFVLREL